MMSPAVTVVIPTYQRCSFVQRAVEALAGQTLAPDEYEVVVSVDGSEDGTREMLAEQRVAFQLRSVWHPNRGRAAARNAGAAVARGRVVIFLDDDMEPTPRLLAAHVEAHASAQPGRMRAVIGAAPIVTRPSTSLLTAFLAKRFQERLDALGRPERIPRFDEAYTGNLSLLRATFLELGGFDESFDAYGHEDYEFALRLLKAGGELVFSRAALAYQHEEKDFATLGRDAMARGRTAVLFASKHPEIAGQLRLGAYEAGTRKWRLLRGALLGLTRVFSGLPSAVISLVTTLERRPPRRLDRYYTMALDYLYWVGARAALRSRSPFPGQ